MPCLSRLRQAMATRSAPPIRQRDLLSGACVRRSGGSRFHPGDPSTGCDGRPSEGWGLVLTIGDLTLVFRRQVLAMWPADGAVEEDQDRASDLGRQELVGTVPQSSPRKRPTWVSRLVSVFMSSSAMSGRTSCAWTASRHTTETSVNVISRLVAQTVAVMRSALASLVYSASSPLGMGETTPRSSSRFSRMSIEKRYRDAKTPTLNASMRPRPVTQCLRLRLFVDHASPHRSARKIGDLASGRVRAIT